MGNLFFNGELKIIEKKFAISEIADGYANNENEEEGGVFGMCGNLTMRPKFQRSYIRKNDDKWKKRLIYSIMSGYPINPMCFGDNGDGTYDMIDGQQRTITICDFINGGFSIDYDGHKMYFLNLPKEVKEKIYNYELSVNICIGSQAHKLKWFEIINSPISELTKQELRNATYCGEWLEKLKRVFSAPTANVIKEVTDKESRYYAGRYVEKPKIERQEILELVLNWASYMEFPEIKNKDERIERYKALMAINEII